MTRYYTTTRNCIYKIVDDDKCYQYIENEWLYTGRVRGNSAFQFGLIEIQEEDIMLELL